MLNQYPLWKYIALVLTLIIGTIYALPNLYGEDPAVQVSGRTKSIDQDGLLVIEKILRDNKIEFKSSELTEGRVLVRFKDEDTQLKAADLLKANLDKNHLVALNLAPATP